MGLLPRGAACMPPPPPPLMPIPDFCECKTRSPAVSGVYLPLPGVTAVSAIPWDCRFLTVLGGGTCMGTCVTSTWVEEMPACWYTASPACPLCLTVSPAVTAPASACLFPLYCGLPLRSYYGVTCVSPAGLPLLPAAVTANRYRLRICRYRVLPAALHYTGHLPAWAAVSPRWHLQITAGDAWNTGYLPACLPMNRYRLPASLEPRTCGFVGCWDAPACLPPYNRNTPRLPCRFMGALPCDRYLRNIPAVPPAAFQPSIPFRGTDSILGGSPFRWNTCLPLPHLEQRYHLFC